VESGGGEGDNAGKRPPSCCIEWQIIIDGGSDVPKVTLKFGGFGGFVVDEYRGGQGRWKRW
jgi:hypothetical protein